MVNHFLTEDIKFICSIALLFILLNSLRIKYLSSGFEKVESSQRMLFVKGMTCSHCEESVRKNLLNIKGVSNIQIELSTGKVIYSDNGKSGKAIIDSIESLGYEIVKK